MRAIEIIGEPDGEEGYLGRSYDSNGNAEVMHLRIDDEGVFHFAGGGEIAPAAQPLRGSDRSCPIDPHRRKRSSVDDGTVGTVRGRHDMATLDGHWLHQG